MKTINTTLPVYDRLGKQIYQQVLNNKLDKRIPTVTPRHRLPSMQWNVTGDSPGDMQRIELIKTDGTKLVNTHGLSEWCTETWANISFGTLTSSLLEISSCIDAGGAAGAARSKYFAGYNGEVITFHGTLTINAGVAPRIRLMDYLDNQIGTQTLSTGVNTVSFTFTSDSIYYFELSKVADANAVDFSLLTVSVDITNFINYFLTGEKSVYRTQNNSYDTFTKAVAAFEYINFTVEKTVAAGEEFMYCAWAPNPTTIACYTSKRVRVDCFLVFNGGATTPPKVELRDAATWTTAYSNTVTLAAGRNTFILTPTNNAGAAAHLLFYNSDTELTNYTIYFAEAEYSAFEPQLVTDGTDTWFEYGGDALTFLLPEGEYYLKMYSEAGYVYYSDWFEVDCVYPNLITGWNNATYDTFTTSDTRITSAINAAGAARGYSSSFSVIKGETIRIIFFLTSNSGEIPSMIFQDGVNYLSTAITPSVGLNNITRSMLENSNGAFLDITNTAASNFSISEVIIIRKYSDKYIRIDFSNDCDIAGIFYEGGMGQTLWLESETLEPTFPYTEKGVENGLGRFVPSYQRQDKIWLLRTKLIPQYIVDVLHRLKLHDDIDLIDTVGNEYAVKHVDVEHDWQFDDKYYATAQVSLDFDEYGLVTGCCN